MKIVTKVLSGLAAAGLVLGMTLPANAYSSYPGQDPNRRSTCPSTYGCLWKDYDYKSWSAGEFRIQFEYGIRDLSQFKYRSTRSVTGAKTGSSFANNGTSGKQVCYYTGRAYTGQAFCLTKGTTVPGFTDWRDDIAQSVRFQ